jgi:undecaprenyl-diphosphatase
MSTAVAEPDDDAAPLVATSDADPEEIVGYVRSASDVLRLFTFGVLALLLLALARWAEEGLLGVERDLSGLFEFVSPAAERLLAGAGQIAQLFILFAVLIPPFVTRRYRLLGYLLTGTVITGIVMTGAVRWLDHTAAHRTGAIIAGHIGPDLDAVHPVFLAQVVCWFIILGPFVGLRWRRTGAITGATLTVLQLIVSNRVPTEMFAGIAIGATVGCLVLLLYGRPDQRPTVAAVRRALEATGVRAPELVRDPNLGRRATAFFIAQADGSRLYTKVKSPEERSADLLFRTYRFVRLKNVGDERPFLSLRRSVEHEALVSLLARDAGVRTPGVRAVAGVGDESMLLVYEFVEGTRFDRLDDDAITDDLLHELWRQVGIMREHGIAHRDLRRANVIVDGAGAPWLIDFGFSEVAASERALATDLAQVLVALGLAIGAARTVDAGVAVLGADALATALPLLQPGALAGATRAGLKHHRDLLDQLRDEIMRHGVAAPPALAQLERFSRRKIFTVATLGLATYFLIPQFGNVGDIFDQVGDAQWWWFVPVVLAAIITFVGATLAVMGSVNTRLPSVPTFLAQIASAFASKLAPAGLGGMALNTRFVQKAGVDPTIAVTSVGLNFVAGVVVHVAMLVIFAVWAGRDAFGSISLPDPTVALYGLGGVAVVAGIGFAIPAVRKQITGRLVPIVRRSFGGIASTLRHPGKVALLLGGSALVTFSYLVALFFAVEAFGGSHLSFAQIGSIYLVASAIATVAPTPGGLGALEAAAIAGLVAAGMPNAVAVPSVFLYRLATFWIPVVPGWVALTYLERAEYL